MDETVKASDELWLDIMKHDIAEHGNDKWQLASKKSSECELCKEPGATVLLRCENDKCSRKFHPDCAFHLGGLLLTDEGILSVHCDSHIKPLIFCSCKEKYDDSRPMVYCDECFDWFHNSCEGLGQNSIRADESYVCKSCKASLRQGKIIPQSLKDKNIAKETRSAEQQHASRVIGLLVELTVATCPIVDDILARRRSDFTIDQILEAKKELCSSPFSITTAQTKSKRQQQDGFDGQSSSTDLEAFIQKLGVQKTVNKWKSRLSDYIDAYNEWFRQAKTIYQRHIGKLVISFKFDQVTVVQRVCVELAELENSAISNLGCIPANMSGFYTFFDCMKWIELFLQVC